MAASVLGRIGTWKNKGKYLEQADSHCAEPPAALNSVPSKKRVSLHRRLSRTRRKEPDDHDVTNNTPVVKVVVERDIGQQLGVLTKSLRRRLIICLVRAESPAHKAGLEMGDELLQYGDAKTVGMYPDEFGKMVANESQRATGIMKTPILKRQCPFLSHFALNVLERITRDCNRKGLSHFISSQLQRKL